MNKTILAVLIILLISTLIGGVWWYQSSNSTDKWVQKVVAYKLYDGESARFRNIRVVTDGTYCGEVNSKNRMGAYTGFTGFSVLGFPPDPQPLIRFVAEGFDGEPQRACPI